MQTGKLSWVAAIVFLCLFLAGGTQTQPRRTHTDRKVGFTLVYPADWYAVPSGYGNASEFRNYDESHRVPEKDEARILVTWEQPLSLDQARRRVNDLLKSASRKPGFREEKVLTGVNELHQWMAHERPAVPALGKPTSTARMRIRVSAAVVGVPLVRAEGTAWADASPQVVGEMKEITRSIKLLDKGGTK